MILITKKIKYKIKDKKVNTVSWSARASERVAIVFPRATALINTTHCHR